MVVALIILICIVGIIACVAATLTGVASMIAIYHLCKLAIQCIKSL